MPEPFLLPLFPDRAALIRIEPARNAWRFYRMAVWSDLGVHAQPLGIFDCNRGAGQRVTPARMVSGSIG